jgi:hypothetical protein
LKHILEETKLFSKMKNDMGFQQCSKMDRVYGSCVGFDLLLTAMAKRSELVGPSRRSTRIQQRQERKMDRAGLDLLIQVIQMNG